MKHRFLEISALVAMLVFTTTARAQINYGPSSVAVAIACVTKYPLPTVPDINPDTGKPDPRLPLVESATWQTFDRNGNPT